MIKNNKKTCLAYALSSALLLNGCGSDSETPATKTIPLVPPTESSIDITVIDGYVRGANAYVDLNRNGVKDSGEPSVITGEGGRGTIVTTSLDIDLENAVIVVDIPVGAVDESTITDSNPQGVPITADTVYQLVSLPGETIATPLTTLIAMTASVSAKGDITAEDILTATEAVAEKLGITPDEVTADYLESNNDVLAEVATLIVKHSVIPKKVTGSITQEELLIATVVTDKINEAVIEAGIDGESNNAIVQAIAVAAITATRDFVEQNNDELTAETVVNFTVAANAVAESSVAAFDDLKASTEAVTTEQLEKSALFAQVASTVVGELLVTELDSEDAISVDTLKAAVQTVDVIRDSVIEQIALNSTVDSTDNLSIDDISKIAALSGQEVFDEIEVLLDADLNTAELADALIELSDKATETVIDLVDTVKNSEEDIVIDDLDGDGIVNSSDTDIDGDGVLNDTDAFAYNAGENLDTDGDKIGNNADTDDDGDGYLDADEIAAKSDPLAKDSLPDDMDNDKISDATDTDIDGDGVLNDVDAFPLNANESLDTDGDKIGNNADTDDDGDGYLDADELTSKSDPLANDSHPADMDNDKISDATDTDDDGDGYLDADEIAAKSDPLDKDSLPDDLDNDKISDATDTDIDGDGFLNDADAFPLDANSSMTLADIDFANVNILECINLEYPLTTPNGDIEYFNCASSGIDDLSGIEHLTSLKGLDLDNNQLTDISALSALTSLEYINLTANKVTDISALSGLTSLVYLTLNDNQISDLSALADLTALYNLNLKNNQVTDISALSGLINLSYLSLGYNQITDISALSGLTLLERIFLYDNQITDISALSGLPSLEGLYLQNNQIAEVVLTEVASLKYLYLANNQLTDISSLSELTSLETLDIAANAITDISALSSLTLLETLNFSPVYVTDFSVLTELPSLEWATADNENNILIDSDGDSLIDLVDTDDDNDGVLDEDDPAPLDANNWVTLENMSFVDENLAACINEDHVPTTLNGTIVNVTCTDNVIMDLTGIDNLPSLRMLWLWNSQITDYSALQNLSIIDLTIHDNQAEDLSAIAGLSELDYFSFKGINVTNISHLSELVVLRGLNLEVDKVVDISSLSELTSLTSLSIYKTALGDPIVDMSPIAELALLTDLSLSGNGITEVSSLLGLTLLTSLDLSGNDIIDVNNISSLTSLTTLKLSDNDISDLSGLSSMESLELLTLDKNNITDISSLANLTSLTWLSLAQNDILDIYVISELTNLTSLQLQWNQITDISALAELTSLGLLSLEYNPIDDISSLAQLSSLTHLGLDSTAINDITTILNWSVLPSLWLGLADNAIDCVQAAALDSRATGFVVNYFSPLSSCADAASSNLLVGQPLYFTDIEFMGSFYGPSKTLAQCYAWEFSGGTASIYDYTGQADCDWYNGTKTVFGTYTENGDNEIVVTAAADSATSTFTLLDTFNQYSEGFDPAVYQKDDKLTVRVHSDKTNDEYRTVEMYKNAIDVHNYIVSSKSCADYVDCGGRYAYHTVKQITFDSSDQSFIYNPAFNATIGFSVNELAGSDGYDVRVHFNDETGLNTLSCNDIYNVYGGQQFVRLKSELANADSAYDLPYMPTECVNNGTGAYFKFEILATPTVGEVLGITIAPSSSMFNGDPATAISSYVPKVTVNMLWDGTGTDY